MRLARWCLLAAGPFEIGWPPGFKLSQRTRFKWPFIVLVMVVMALSGVSLWLAPWRQIPVGTAYAVRTGGLDAECHCL